MNKNSTKMAALLMAFGLTAAACGSTVESATEVVEEGAEAVEEVVDGDEEAMEDDEAMEDEEDPDHSDDEEAMEDDEAMEDEEAMEDDEAMEDEEAMEDDEATADVPATVVDIATSSDDFSTLVAAVTEAGLVETLQGEGPFTVFAPTNAAFETALADLGLTAEELLASEDLASILTYHVVAGEVDSAAAIAADGTSVETVQGGTIDVAVVDGSVVLNGAATVTTVDLVAGNGIVHVIDAVLLPAS